MNAFFSIIKRDILLGLRQGGDILTLVLFFLSIGIVIPFAVGPDTALLSRIAPAVIWVAALLAQLLSSDRIFKADYDDGSLPLFQHSVISIQAIVFAKLIAHWTLTCIPLIFSMPILAVMMGMKAETYGIAILSLLVGTPALVAFGTIGASVTVGLKRGGLIAPILVLPLCLPVLIFGAGTMSENIMSSQGQATLFLCALSLASVVLAPFAAALALEISGE